MVTCPDYQQTWEGNGKTSLSGHLLTHERDNLDFSCECKRTAKNGTTGITANSANM